MKIRVFVIEDHPLMRRSLVEAIERETDLTVCGQAEDADEALAAVIAVRPDIVLTDIQLKSSNGLDFIKAIRAHAPALPVVATTMFDVQRTERLARLAGKSKSWATATTKGPLWCIIPVASAVTIPLSAAPPSPAAVRPREWIRKLSKPPSALKR